jgi:putative heme-binding domain-containing protein
MPATQPRWPRTLLILVTLPACLSAAGGQKPADSPDVEAGRKIFTTLCVVCHGSEGGGGEAPSLNRPTLDRAPDDDALRSLIKGGIENRMPAMRHLSDVEVQQAASYVRSLGRTPAAPLVGNVQGGRRVYERVGCPSCHIVNGDGGSFGPALTEIGSIRGAQYLRQSITDPAAALPRGTLRVPGRDFLEFLPVRVMTSDGRTVEGFRVNEDALTIQIRDLRNELHSFRKSDLQRLEKQIGKSLMPSFRDRVSESELDDLVAYLASLRGTP